ncbi:glycosyltransferase family 4 protein [Amylibacter sp.]|jgi:glycosyltransferase involved in cell wall biosynthesis|nr:glycosyltransferase family 4 protein [Amylibacter sp.]
MLFLNKNRNKENTKRKIVIFASAAWPAQGVGGPIESIHRNCLQFSKTGYRVEVFSTYFGIEKNSIKNNLIIFNDNYRARFFKSAYTLKFISNILRINRSDMIIIEDIFWPVCYLIMLISAIKKNKIICIYPRGVLSLAAFKSKSTILKNLYINIFSLYKDIVCTNLIFIFTSKIELKKAKEVISFRNYKVIPNRANLNTAHYQKLTTKNNFFQQSIGSEKIILIVGRVAKQKRLFEALEIISHVNESISCKIFVVGPEGNDIDFLKKEINKRPNFIKYFGEVDQQNLAEFYSIADALIVTSQDENFGNVILEALSHYCPVLTNDTNPWLMLNQDKSGVCAPPGMSYMTRGLTEILKNKRDYYLSGCDTTVSRFSNEVIDLKWQDLINEYK